jgi:hypothetical protein
MKMRLSHAVIAPAAAIALLLASSLKLHADARLAPPAMSLVADQVLGLVVPVTKKTQGKTCIVIRGEQFCIVKGKPGGEMGGAGDEGPPQDNGAGNTEPQQDNGAGNTETQQDNAGTAEPEQDNAGVSPETEPGERTCPVGYVVLDKPNKYGAFCEPKEGFPTMPPTYNCEGDFTPPSGHSAYLGLEASSEEDAKAKFVQIVAATEHNAVPAGPITCTVAAAKP